MKGESGHAHDVAPGLKLLQWGYSPEAGGDEHVSKLLFWVYITAIVVVLLLVALSAVWYYSWTRADEKDGRGAPSPRRAPAPASGSLAENSRNSAQSAARGKGKGRRLSLQAVSVGSASVNMSLSPTPADDDAQSEASHGSSEPLCPLLIVPEGTRLACVVQNNVCRRRQDLSFNLRGKQSCGGAALFQVRVSERSGLSAGIYVETLGGKEQLAFLATDELWRGSPRPVLGISRPSGEPYGSVRRGEGGEYVLQRRRSNIWVFSGDFAGHRIQVVTTGGRFVASVWPGSADEYHVYVQSRVDAGLLVLGLLAIDKCEIEPPVSSTTASP